MLPSALGLFSQWRERVAFAWKSRERLLVRHLRFERLAGLGSPLSCAERNGMPVNQLYIDLADNPSANQPFVSSVARGFTFSPFLLDQKMAKFRRYSDSRRMEVVSLQGLSGGSRTGCESYKYCSSQVAELSWRGYLTYHTIM